MLVTEKIILLPETIETNSQKERWPLVILENLVALQPAVIAVP